MSTLSNRAETCLATRVRRGRRWTRGPDVESKKAIATTRKSPRFSSSQRRRGGTSATACSRSDTSRRKSRAETDLPNGGSCPTPRCPLRVAATRLGITVATRCRRLTSRGLLNFTRPRALRCTSFAFETPRQPFAFHEKFAGRNVHGVPLGSGSCSVHTVYPFFISPL